MLTSTYQTNVSLRVSPRKGELECFPPAVGLVVKSSQTDINMEETWKVAADEHALTVPKSVGG